MRPPTTFRAALDPSGLRQGRYRLYVSYACPWAHRTLIARAWLGLESCLPVTSVDPLLTDDGWGFSEANPDPLWGASWLREFYAKADPEYTGRVTVPVLWDVDANTIVNNESREILRMFSDLAGDPSLAPPGLRSDIDACLEAIYEPINNGVYRCGFARSQSAYDEAVNELFAALDGWEARLAEQPFACGQRLTEADVCLFTTLLRFDPVYHVHFKCSHRRIVDYPHLWAYLRSLYQLPGTAATCNLQHIRFHYFASHTHINPYGIVARGPELDYATAHGRWERFPQADLGPAGSHPTAARG